MKVDPDTGGVEGASATSSATTSAAPSIPTLVKGQIAGGFAQGLGGALMEEFTYNESGDPLAVDLRGLSDADRARDAGRGDHPARGLSDRRSIRSASRARARAASTRVGAAIASAIDDAIGIPGAITQLPVTPQRLRQLLNGNRAGLRQM